MQKNRKHILVLVASVMICIASLCALSACGGGSGGSGPGGAKEPETKLEGPPEDILNKIIEEAMAAMPEGKPMPMVYTAEVTSETSQNQLGLSAADFDKYVSSASVATALIGTFAHEISMIQAKDNASAAEVKKLIAADGGYDSSKWICVFPETSCVIESGPYVLLAVSRAEVVDAVLEAFTAAAGVVGEANVFFTHEGGAAEGGMGIAVGGGPAAIGGGPAPIGGGPAPL